MFNKHQLNPIHNKFHSASLIVFPNNMQVTPKI